MPHRNAPLTETGRLRLARCVVDDGWPLRRAAERFQVAVTTAKRWAGRYRQYGEAGMSDRSSRPHSSPRRTPDPDRTPHHQGADAAPVGTGPDRLLARPQPRHGAPGLDPLRHGPARPPGPRHEAADSPLRTPAPGDLVHVDIKKLGNIPDGGGHKIHGRATGGRNSSAHRDPARPRTAGGRARLGYGYLHNAVDDHSRLAYTEILPDETKETAAAFWTRAQAFFTTAGITITRVLTDNGSCYRSHLWREPSPQPASPTNAPAPTARKPTARSNASTAPSSTNGPTPALPHRNRTPRALPRWLHTYNHHRGHTALGGHPPASRVPNLTGQYN